MSGFFGVISKEDCVRDLFYGTDYHSHLGTVRGGMVVHNAGGFSRHIHDITNAHFRSKFEDDLPRLHGRKGLGVISDYEDQPLIIGSHLGNFAIVTVGKINNMEELVGECFRSRPFHFTEMDQGEINPTELIATLITQEESIESGIRRVHEMIDGSCSLLLLTDSGLYAGRDRYGRTPILVGRKKGAWCATLESSALPNLDYEIAHHLGPGEIVRITEEGYERLQGPGEQLQVCAFLWIYYGYPASMYEGINVEIVRNRCGACLADRDSVTVDLVAGIPDSGTGHAIGYGNAKGVAFARPFVKYTPTWPRSFMPQDQRVRNLVARMKLIPIRDIVQDKRLLFCEDSIVRGTQLQDNIQRLYRYGAREVHMRPACPPLLFGCRYLNFSRSRSELDLAGRKAVKELEGQADAHLEEYSTAGTERYEAMVERIRKHLRLTSLMYQRIEDMVAAIGLPRRHVCTYCWDGCRGGESRADEP